VQTWTGNNTCRDISRGYAESDFAKRAISSANLPSLHGGHRQTTRGIARTDIGSRVKNVRSRAPEMSRRARSLRIRKKSGKELQSSIERKTLEM
jgi:hypothetical protein